MGLHAEGSWLYPKRSRVITGLADQEATARGTQLIIPLLRAAIPGEPGGIIGQLPVLRLVAEQIPPGLHALATTPPYGERPGGAAVTFGQQRRWGWNTTFLGSLTATLRKEVVGVMPDGFRINWHVIQGSFVGPGVEATILPGATDWSRIRKDGVGTVASGDSGNADR